MSLETIIRPLYSTNASDMDEHGRVSTDYDCRKVVTSSNSAYGVVSANENHEYEVIGLQQMDTHHMSTTGHSH